MFFPLGHDIRAVRNRAKEVTRALLGQADEDLFSVDDRFWPSVWSTCLEDAPRPEFLGPTQNLWEEFSVLRQQYASAMVGRMCETAMFISIDALVPGDEEVDMFFWEKRSELVEPSPEETRTLLGYDVADVYLGSWLDGDVNPDVVWPATFGEREGLTRSGLLLDEASAQSLADAMQARSKRDWYAYRLWRVAQP